MFYPYVCGSPLSTVSHCPSSAPSRGPRSHKPGPAKGFFLFYFATVECSWVWLWVSVKHPEIMLILTDDLTRQGVATWWIFDILTYLNQPWPELRMEYWCQEWCWNESDAWTLDRVTWQVCSLLSSVFLVLFIWRIFWIVVSFNKCTLSIFVWLFGWVIFLFPFGTFLQWIESA